MNSNLYAKLAKARVILQNKNLKKTGFNEHSKFYYFELADFLPAVNEIFNDLHLCTSTQIEGGVAILRVIDCDVEYTGTNHVAFVCPIREITPKMVKNKYGETVPFTNEMQNMGSVITYARRYLYLMALEIIENDSLDSDSPNKITNSRNSSVNTTKSSQNTSIDADKIIADITDLESLNKVFNKLKSLPNLDSSWKKKLNDKAKTLNCQYDLSSKSFIKIVQKTQNQNVPEYMLSMEAFTKHISTITFVLDLNNFLHEVHNILNQKNSDVPLNSEWIIPIAKRAAEMQASYDMESHVFVSAGSNKPNLKDVYEIYNDSFFHGK